MWNKMILLFALYRSLSHFVRILFIIIDEQNLIDLIFVTFFFCFFEPLESRACKAVSYMIDRGETVCGVIRAEFLYEINS